MKADIIYLANTVKKNSYSPHSGFSVGSALFASDGSVFSGCNVENVSFSVTTCAEESAIAAMIAAGQKEIKEIVVVASQEGKEVPCSPCGACRQRIAEFGTKDTLIHFVDDSGDMVTKTIPELLPYGFSFE